MAYKVFGNENPVTAELGSLTQGLGFPLRPVETFAASPIETIVLFAPSFVAQEPTGLDNPLQLTFGSPQSNVFIDLDANGLVTILQAGTYKFELRAAVGRTSVPGAAIILARSLINGVQLGNSLHANIPDLNTSLPLFAAFTRSFSVNDTWASEIMRSSTGIDSGGLYPETTAVSGWANSPSVQVVVTRLSVEAN